MKSPSFPVQNSTKLVVLSGLGVDKRVFDEIDFYTLDVEFIDWIVPLRNESIANYARRIASEIQSDNPILLGLSFGGIMAVEIGKVMDVQMVILLASAKTKDEIPRIYRAMGLLQLHKLAPVSLFKVSNTLTNWFFGARSPSDKKLLKQILKDTDTTFLQWAINCIVNWKNMKIPKNYVHIHGAKDRILPIKNIKVDYVIRDGGHFMTVNKADEISQLLSQIMDKHGNSSTTSEINLR